MAAESILRLAFRRSLASKRLMAVVALGVFVAASLLAAAPIYNRAMADLGLTFTIRDQLSASPSTQIHFDQVPLQTAEGQALRAAVEQRIQQRIGWFSASEAQYTQLGRFGIAAPGAPSTPGMLQAQPQSLPGYENHVRVVSGRLPAASAAGTPMEVALSAGAASVAQLKPGDLFDMRESFDTCERVIPQTDPPPPPPPCDPHATASFSYPARVVGIVAPLDDQDPFWVGSASVYFDPFRLRISDIGPVIPMFADQASIMGAFASRYPGYRASISWNVFADPTKLNRANFQLARQDIIGLTTDFQPLGGTAFSPLRDTLAKFAKSASYQQIPLTVLLLEISGIALFYVGLVSAIVVERQSAEIALLRSRGASLLQVATVYAWQGLIIGVPAVLLSPFLAAAATALLGVTPTFHKVTGGSLLPVTIPPLSFLAAAVGVALSLLALLPPALLVARRSTATQRRAESRPATSIIHRYYLDLVFAGLAGVVLFQLHQRGSAFEPSATGGLSSDPLLLAAPALVIAAAAALILRFYPMVLRFIAKAVNAVAGASVSLGLAQVVRNSGQYTRLTLLLMMAVAVGSYGASYAATTNQSYRDRAGYETGADIYATSLGEVPFPEPTASFESKLESIPGVAEASAVTRAGAGPASAGSINQTYQLVGVDPAAVSKMLWWRSDFSSKTLPELMATLAAPAAVPGKLLPGNPTHISIWVKGDDTLAQDSLWARVRDATGRYSVVLLGEGDTGGQWQQLSVPLAPLSGGPLQAPITLVSIVMTLPANGYVLPLHPLLVDDIGVSDASGTTTVVEDFEGNLQWAAFAARSQTQDSLTEVRTGAHSGTGAGEFTFHPGSGIDTRGFYFTPQLLPLAAVVSDSFLSSTGLHIGDSTMLFAGMSTLVPITITGSFKLFPTAPASAGPVVVVNRDQLETWDETAGFTSEPDLVPSTLLFSLKPGADSATVVKALGAPALGLNEIESRGQTLDTNSRNPLIAAGGSGILFLSFVAVLTLVAAALLVSLMTSLGRRKTEFAVVRSMGVSRAQLLRMLVLEYSVVAIAGTAAGALLGVLVGRQMLSFLNVTETGTRVEPGFVLQTEWGIVASAVGIVFLIFAVALVVATLVMASTADAQALRTE